MTVVMRVTMIVAMPEVMGMVVGVSVVRMRVHQSVFYFDTCSAAALGALIRCWMVDNTGQ
jgi:hypothetical protein